MIIFQIGGTCQSAFDSGGPFYHVCTNGHLQDIIFTCDEDFVTAINFLAYAAWIHGIRILTFVIMSNHVHFILAGDKKTCEDMFLSFKKKLDRYFRKKGRPGSLASFSCEDPILIDSLEMLRCEIAYVIRNPFAASKNFLPYTYRWSNGYVIFNHMVSSSDSIPFNDLKYNEKRAITQSRAVSLPDGYLVRNSCIAPECFTQWRFVEALFENASQFYYYLNKNVESYSSIAKRLGDSACLNDEELFPVACNISKEKFGDKKIKELSFQEKVSLARILHFDYFSNKKQLKRILKLDFQVLDELFPSKE